MLASQALKFAEKALLQAESLWPAQITLPGVDGLIPCAGGSTVFTKPTLELGGMLTGYDVSFRVRKSLVPEMPEVGSLMTFDDVQYRIMRVSAPKAIPAWLIGADNPAK